MAIITLGSTTRASDSIAIQNTTNPGVNLVFAILRSAVIAPGAFKFLTLMDFDARLRGVNLHHNMLYTVGSDGYSQYLDDVAEFCKLVINGDITVFSAESPKPALTATVPGSGGMPPTPFPGTTTYLGSSYINTSGTVNNLTTTTGPATAYGFTLGSKLGVTFGGDGSVFFD